ncbi:MAG: vWA domain-containing protein [Dehalococcoidia bacterium]
MRGGKTDRRGQKGQALVLGVLAMVVLFGFTALAVDVGFFLRHRALVQQAVDAAALAAAQELPDDATAAEQMARDYAQKNGVDPSTIQVSFRCTSTFTIACDPATDKWDTIQVSGQLDVPFFFAPVLAVSGASGNCFLSTCPVVNSAAGCKGLCGGDPTVPVDVVLVLDRTGSMSDGDMDNAKNAGNTLLDTFNAQYHRVGLAVLGAGVSEANPCDDGLPGVWLPDHLVDDYQYSDGSLNFGSKIVSDIDCLDQSSQGTNLGDPMAAAIAELQANGRADTKWGIVLLTDGAANEPLATDVTGWHNCGSHDAVTSSSGDNNGYESLDYQACVNGGDYARDINSGTNTNSSCGNSGKDRHRFYNYGISLPAGATVTGIQVRTDARLNTSSGTNEICAELSWDGGATWTSAKDTGDISSSWTTDYMGADGDTWGRSWTPAELADGNFQIRLTDVGASTSNDFFLDWVTVRVYYDNGTGGPCQYAAEQADLAKALDIEVYTIGYGVDDAGNDCIEDTGFWGTQDAEALLAYMATDEFHFFQETQGADLAPIFQVIAQQLAGGSRLVPTLQN